MIANPKVVLLGGEGIGPEVVEASSRVLTALVPSMQFDRPPHGAAALEAHGSVIPVGTREACERADAVLFGATWKHCGDVLRFLRWGLDAYANVRPSRSRDGVRSPLRSSDGIDLVIVRENTQGEYPTREGDLVEFNQRWPEFRDIIDQAPPSDGYFALRVTSAVACERISTFAGDLALRRRAKGFPGEVTIVTKANVFRRTDGMFLQIAERVLAAKGVPTKHYYVDDACRRLVANPRAIDVILTPNLFGDVMSDIAAELVGGLGVAPSGCYGDRFAYFESVHGSAPDIAGKGVANPIATLLSACMMLERLGYPEDASRLEGAIDRLIVEKRTLTPDMGGVATTDDVVTAVIAMLR